MAPIINSATLGAVKVGDADLLVEMTGTDMPTLTLATNIVACDFADAGYTILPVRVEHPYDTGFGAAVTTPFYFQKPTKASVAAINRLLGSSLTAAEISDALSRMGSLVKVAGDEVTVTPAPYRTDFLHEVDVIEDVMMGMELGRFQPLTPRDFTIGRLSPVTTFSRKAKSLMVGLGYQEMIFNYLGSGKDFIERMCVAGTPAGNAVIEISNPMTENYQFVRPSILPSLLAAEGPSGNAVYPHRIFEIGKVAYLCDGVNTGTRTRQHLGFLSASSDANFNEAASQVASILYYLDHEYSVVESADPRFIPGRQAEILAALGRAFPCYGVMERSDAPVRVLEGLPPVSCLASGSVPPRIVMEEGGLRYGVDLATGQKTGWFLDQRANRAAAASYAKGKRLLDAFCNAGGFALSCAAAGAAEVEAVDSSPEAIAAVSANARLNGLEGRVRPVQANAFDFLRERERDREKFGLIVLDPPAFAKNRASVEGARRGYKELNLRALKLLAPGGILVTC